MSLPALAVGPPVGSPAAVQLERSPAGAVDATEVLPQQFSAAKTGTLAPINTPTGNTGQHKKPPCGSLDACNLDPSKLQKSATWFTRSAGSFALMKHGMRNCHKEDVCLLYPSCDSLPASPCYRGTGQTIETKQVTQAWCVPIQKWHHGITGCLLICQACHPLRQWTWRALHSVWPAWGPSRTGQCVHRPALHPRQAPATPLLTLSPGKPSWPLWPQRCPHRTWPCNRQKAGRTLAKWLT